MLGAVPDNCASESQVRQPFASQVLQLLSHRVQLLASGSGKRSESHTQAEGEEPTSLASPSQSVQPVADALEQSAQFGSQAEQFADDGFGKYPEKHTQVSGGLPFNSALALIHSVQSEAFGPEQVRQVAWQIATQFEASGVGVYPDIQLHTFPFLLAPA